MKVAIKPITLFSKNLQKRIDVHAKNKNIKIDYKYN